MTLIDKYIEDQGAILSGKLAEYIVKTDKIGESAARKRIERLKSPIHKLSGLFADKQSLIYHSDNYNSEIYFQKLKEAFEIAAKRCFSIVTAINYHHGVIAKNDLANYSFSPINNIKGHLKYSTLIEKLTKIGVLIEYDSSHFELNRYISDYVEPNFRHYKAIQFTKDLLINQFGNWSRNIGLNSYKKGQQNSEVAGFQFAFTAPSYISGLVQYKSSVPKPGFVVVDVLIGNKTKLKEIEFFLQKINAIKASNPTLKLFPVLIVDGVDVTALNKLKQTGILIASIKELFGESYNELLKNLINTITNAGTILKKDPENYINLMMQLTKLVEGKTNNLRGDLFELAVGYYYGQHCKFLEIGKKVRPENDIKTREVDVLAIYENEVRVVECKGYNYPIDDTYVLSYLNDKIPALRKWAEKAHTQKVQIFEIWSTGGFTPLATNLLEKARVNTKKFRVDYLNKDDILERAAQLHTSKFMDILKDYYFKEIV